MYKKALELGKEYPPENEGLYLEKMLEFSRERLNRQQKPVMRGEHAKPHGCVKAEFKVLENLPEHLQVGIFREPKTYSAFIRFSNGNSRNQPDSVGDGRGMAIKLLDVPGEKVLDDEKDAKTQDFVLINHPVFFIRNLPDYIDFFETRKRYPRQFPIRFFMRDWRFWQWHLSELKIFTAIGNKKIESLLTLQYWSTTPCKFGGQFGDRAVKFSAKPAGINKLDKYYPESANYLQQIMTEYLQNNDAHFDFYVQIQTDARKMPIEDPTVEWHAPLQKVATIKISPQTFSSPSQISFTENLSYTPWHCLPEHIPLGGINRARKTIYQEISQTRHQDNGTPRGEPTLAEFDSY
jgi:catalase